MDPTNNAQPPMAPSTPSAQTEPGVSPQPSQDSELYNQIAGQDLDPQVVKKANKSFLITLMAHIMRFTLWLDSVKRTHERFFRFLAGVWAFFMGILYLSGILILVFSIYNRLQLPIYLEDQMRARNVQFESAEYTMDRIIVRNLKDQNGTYTIDTMVIYSTFTDLLQKRIRLVTLDGLNIFVNTKSDFNPLQDVPQLLTQIQNPTRGRVDLTINSITVHNAKLTFKNQQMDIPISFSMEGMYGDKAQIVIPLSIQQPSLRAKAILTIAGSNQYPEWTLSVSEGMITLPRSSPENISGNFKVTLDNKNLDSVQADFKMGYGTIEKHITANLHTKGEDSLAGQIIWEKNNLTEQDLSSQLTFDISKLALPNKNAIHITGPLTISSKQFNMQNFGLIGMSAPLNVDIKCQDWAQCIFSLKEKAFVTVQDAWIQSQRQTLHTQESLQFTLLPQEEAFILREKNPYISFTLPIQTLDVKGVVEGLDQKLSLRTSSAVLSGDVADTSTDASRLALKANELFYQSPAMVIENATLNAENLLSHTSNLQMQSNSVQLANLPLFSHPFNLDLTMLGNKSTAKLTFHDTPITMQLDGQLSLSQKAFAGQVRINPFNLEELSIPLHDLWPSVPTSLRNITGQIAVIGQVTWLGAHNISGPLSVGFKDISFDLNDAKVSGLNTVLMLETLQPLVTKPNQHLYVRTINDLIPFQGLDTVFQLDGQNLRLNQLSTSVSGILLNLPASVIAVKNPNALLYLKNDQPIQAKDFPKSFHIEGIGVASGTANLSVPLAIQNGIVSIPNITLKMQNTLIQNKNGDEYEDIFNESDSYFIRSGQITLDRDNLLQLVFNGRLLPSKTPKDVQFNDVQVPDDLFKTLPDQELPKDINMRLNVLFSN